MLFPVFFFLKKNIVRVLAYCNKVQVLPMVFFIRNYLHAEFLAKYCSFANSGESQKKQHVNWQKKLQIF